MPHTHHSHSGQFCNHATGSLADIVEHMVNIKKMTTIALTEHMPRPTEHLYPDEVTDGWPPERLLQVFEDFIPEAQKLRCEIESSYPDVQVLIGFEGEWIDEYPELATRRIQAILNKYPRTFDLWIGSVHHAMGEPIDYDNAGFQRALTKCGGDEDSLFCSYFDSQYELITRLKPPVIGHFDLIRLKSKTPDKSLEERVGVWQRVLRNLNAVHEYGGVLELNTSALRKGLEHPYPRGEVVREWHRIEGVLVLSDDSHGISQIATCYDQVSRFLKDQGVDSIGVMRRAVWPASPSQVNILPLEKVIGSLSPMKQAQ